MSPRRRLVIATALAVVLIALAIVVVKVVAGRVSPDGPADQARLGTVLLVPGYGGNVRTLQQLADRLRSEGRTVSVVTPPGDGTGDLRQQADTLDAAVRQALRDGAPSVDIVGYSAGGVVTRLWLDRENSASSTRRVVTLGSPLHGTKLAAAGAALAPDACPAACRQLVPGSDLLRDLDEDPVPVPWLSVWTDNDETVQPPDSARVDGAVNMSIQSVCPAARIAHAQLPTDPLITALVLRSLGTAPLGRPADCAALSG